MPATEEVEILTRIDDLLRESAQGRSAFIAQACLNDTMYLGHIPANERPRDGLSYILINKTGQAIIAHAQIQLETKPRTLVKARQTSGKPEHYLTRKALTTIRDLIVRGVLPGFEDQAAEIVIEEEADLTSDPLEDEGFEFALLDAPSNGRPPDAFQVPEAFMARIGPLFSQWPMADGSTAEPVLKMGDHFMVDDQIVARAVQNNLDIAWETGDRDLWLRNNVVNCLKFGTQGAMFVFDQETRTSKVFDIHVYNLFLPPNCTSIQDAEYVMVREIISAREAVERFPQAAEAIEAASKRDTGDTSSADGSDGHMPYQNIRFGRNMVTLWHIWWRNERYPFAPNDALDMGRVVLRGGAMYLTDREYNVTEELTNPELPNWPTRLGIRYLQRIGQTIVSDDECGHVDIPVVLNQNIPVSYSPWAQGEPERLWFCQKLIDKMSSIILDHITYFRSPQQILPASVYKRLKGLNMIYSRPDRDAWIDDGTFETYREFFKSGKGFYIDPPTLSAQYVELWHLALRLHDELSGHAGVLQGRSPGANSSGRLVEELQTAARGMIGFKAASTETMLRNLARLEIDAQSKWVPLFMWKRANDELPVDVLAAVRKRSSKCELDVSVELASGGAELRKQKQAVAREEVMQQLRSPQSYRRLAEIDDDPDWQPPPPVLPQVPQGAAA